MLDMISRNKHFLLIVTILIIAFISIFVIGCSSWFPQETTTTQSITLNSKADDAKYKILASKNMQDLNTQDIIWLVNYCNRTVVDPIYSWQAGIMFSTQANTYELELLRRK
jgi:hypothetical protein